MRGNTRICGTDLNNYSSLASKWKNNKNLKDWWRTRSADEKVDWYRSEQTHTAGAKRDFSWITFTETNRQEQQRARVTINNHLCLTQYIRAKFCEGVPRDVAIRELDLFVRTNPQLCVYENNQWRMRVIAWHPRARE